MPKLIVILFCFFGLNLSAQTQQNALLKAIAVPTRADSINPSITKKVIQEEAPDANTIKTFHLSKSTQKGTPATILAGANDACASAVALTSGVAYADNNLGATVAGTDPIPTCPGCGLAETVWYKFTTPASAGNLTVTVTSLGGPTDIWFAGVAVYSGTCGAFTQLACNSPCLATGTTAQVSLTCLAASTTYYIMVWDDVAGDGGNLTITATFAAVAGCSGTPTGGTAAASVTSFTCTGGPTNLSLTGATTGCGLTYQWQSSPDNITWTNIAGATSATYTPTVGATTYYRCVLTCAASGLFSNSASVLVTVVGAAPNNNYANATIIVVPGTATAQSTACSNLETSESVACNVSPPATTVDQTVWYAFTATTTKTYIQISLITGNIAFFGASVWTGTTYQTTAAPFCGMVTCESMLGNVAATNPFLFEICSTVGTTYHIQVVNSFAGSGANATFSVSITNTNPGGTITSPCPPPGQPISSLASPIPTCYITAPCGTTPAGCPASPPCTDYTMTPGNGANNNIVYNAYYSFTTGAGCSNFLMFQVCVSSTCGGGNVSWMSWQLFDLAGNCIASGDLSSPGITTPLGGIGCNQPYVIQFTQEWIGCNYTFQRPFTNNYGSSSCVLPIELLYFKADENEREYIELTWATATETNNAYFTIERSLDAKNFTAIGKVNGSKNSLNTVKYNYTDETDVVATTLYYRLSQTDFNGEITIFNIIEINKTRKFSFSVYPNPSTGDFNLDFVAQQGSLTQVELYDATNNLVSTKLYMSSGGLQHQKLDPMQSGVYFLKIKINGQVLYKKIVKL